ncbi:MAG: YraN family protein [bacterium]
MLTYRTSLGKLGEHDALVMLNQKGYTLRESNWRCRGGEIDLVVEKGNLIVFIEVKLRQNYAYGSAEYAVHKIKQRRIVRAAVLYMKLKNLYNKDVRFDVISIMPEGMHHIEDAFSAEGYCV